MGENEDVRELCDLVLDTIARELGIRRDQLPLEVEQVVAGALFEASRRARRANRPPSSTKTPMPRLRRDDSDE